MASRARSIALTLIAAAAVGTGTWATLRTLARQRPAPPTRADSRAAGPMDPGAAPAAPAARRIKATLYYVSADGLGLEAAERDVPFADGASEQGKRIVEALLEPAPDGRVSAIPPGTTLRALYLGGRGDAYADFSDGLRAHHPGGSQHELLTVYAIVDTLTANLPAITSVQILVDGREVDSLAGHVDLRRPLPNTRLRAEKGTP
ncbi:MAG TPA: GerMN domain-containing protein [Vicinamibacterales bacterium]|nr:GerMN domain-containing protein [Vicinamibacterales bacterium]HOQ60696.1 GerMN domain-containing protein [Vicinamibacterales bacterium]HPK70848.1 GerMN domain-containing protein [Vicinamibacterales bacterium]